MCRHITNVVAGKILSATSGDGWSEEAETFAEEFGLYVAGNASDSPIIDLVRRNLTIWIPDHICSKVVGAPYHSPV